MFLDRARVVVHGGHGGSGAINFRREAHVPRGGPDGGDGGGGGDVVLVATARLSTLADFRYERHLRAGDGGRGGSKKRHGKNGGDLVVPVPAGTLIKDERGGVLVDLATEGDRVVVARGGVGGKGNARFATSTRRAPRIAEDGDAGEERRIELELKLLADVGLVGLPNAGKSTLLAALTRARPKIADYPFTTLAPNLGVATVGDREIVLADIPGLIEGAHAGAGLGEDFLRHIERTRLLVHIVDCARPDPLDDVRVIDAELAAYGRGLAERPQVYALNKIDLPEARERAERVRRALPRRGMLALPVSALTGEGCRELLETAAAHAPPPERVAVASPPVERRITYRGTTRDWEVAREGDGVRIRSPRLERLARGIDWQSPDALTYFQRVLERSGIDAELRRLGVAEGDTVHVGDVELEWREVAR